MFRLQNLLLFFALVVGVFGAATPFKPVQCRNQASNVKLINRAFAFPKQFCEWYNGAARRASPMSNIKAVDFIKSCECLVQKHASKTIVAFGAPGSFDPKCNKAEHKRLMAIAKRQPRRFCEFWGKGKGNSFRMASPFQREGMSNMHIYNACACMEGGMKPAAVTAASATESDAPASATESGLPASGTDGQVASSTADSTNSAVSASAA